MTEKTNIWVRIGKLDRRLLMWALVVSVALSGVYPITFPIAVTDPVQRAYGIIQSLNQGDLAIMAPDFSAASYTAVGASGIAMIEHMMKRGAGIVFVSSFIADSVAMALRMQTGAKIDSQYKYGVDYVNLGYIPGSEAFVNALALDFRANVKTDVRGTPIGDIPLMSKVKTAKDFKVVICLSSADAIQWWAKHWALQLGTKVIAGMSGGTVNLALPYYPGRGVDAYINDVVGGGQYEFLLGIPGQATIALGMQNMSHLWMFFWIGLGNLAAAMEILGRKHGR